MKIPLVLILFLFGSSLPSRSETDTGMPIMTAVDPGAGTNGDLVTAQGANLSSDIVAAVFLTDGKNDLKAVIVEQAPTSIKFKIPPNAKAGRYALMVLTQGKDSKLIEEPVKLTVEPSAAVPTS